MHGKGVFTTSEWVHTGELVEDVFSGHGVRRLTDGSVYDGEWKDDKRSG